MKGKGNGNVKEEEEKVDGLETRESENEMENKNGLKKMKRGK